MKKSLIPAVMAAVAIVSAGSFASCNGNKTSKEDSANVIEEMVATVEEATAPSDTAKYGAAFFNNPEKKADTPSDSTYMVTPTGLKYVVVKEGSGKSPSATQEVTVHYTGMLTDGTVFDSSVARGEPATFPLNRVIAGWTEGLQLMKEGGETIFYIPSNLGYGAQGAPGAIPPNADLIFDVQLIGVN
ncbi:MAG: FKBP-type peptidyl-prolyl cis-trans isomerase [Muribaculaceae bacterium]|nr:FKBP-type peptidyl-prolyl cis-trans isomerase [Muribaculaceae bacterium]